MIDYLYVKYYIQQIGIILLRLSRGSSTNWGQGKHEMNRVELETYIAETYNAEKDFPWVKHSNYAVFRHSNNQKWFALNMDVSKVKMVFSPHIT